MTSPGADSDGPTLARDARQRRVALGEHRMAKQQSQRSALSQALALLARRAYSRAELTQRLQQKGYSDEDVAAALERVQEYGYVNDEEVAEAVFREAARRHKGPVWVARKLAARGVPEELAAPRVRRSESVARERARELLRKKRGGMAAGGLATRQKLYRFLLGQGYPQSLARHLSHEHAAHETSGGGA